MRSGTSTLRTPAASAGSATSQIPTRTAGHARGRGHAAQVGGLAGRRGLARRSGQRAASAVAATPAKTTSGPTSSAAVPRTGPISVPTIAAASGVPITSPRRPGGARSTTHAKPAAQVHAPARPCVKRAASSSQTSWASPKTRLDTASPIRPASVVGLTPQRPASQPAGIAATRLPAAYAPVRMPGARLRQVELVDVVREQRRDGGEEGDVQQDDRADEDDQAAHDALTIRGSLRGHGPPGRALAARGLDLRLPRRHRRRARAGAAARPRDGRRRVLRPLDGARAAAEPDRRCARCSTRSRPARGCSASARGCAGSRPSGAPSTCARSSRTGSRSCASSGSCCRASASSPTTATTSVMLRIGYDAEANVARGRALRERDGRP